MCLLFAVTLEITEVFSNYYLCLKMICELMVVISETMACPDPDYRVSMTKTFRGERSPHWLSLAGFSF